MNAATSQQVRGGMPLKPRSILIAAPESETARLLGQGMRDWPNFCSLLDATGLIAKLGMFSPQVSGRLELKATAVNEAAILWACPLATVSHLSRLDVISTANFLTEWNSRTGFLNFANAGAAIPDLIFQLKSLSIRALQRDERLFILSLKP